MIDDDVLFLLKDLKEIAIETRLSVDALRREFKLLAPRIDTLSAEVTMLQERAHKSNNLLSPLVYELDQLISERKMRELSLEALEGRVRLLSNELVTLADRKEKSP